ncbi:PREDICTED: protein NEN4-like [Nelumbo nucifera]|uniref:Exonuclease domain-containing protein n=2 Tax=Nelumbo nucifera TaxID=4432 RepID=A0A822ZB51_NELNU|nr:PREDICTED: protein NEN4-like [Nelumbo nucifera]DAD40266.1 TPA_asm: hypothetical protein HUJ06_014589 [Nelumbo nucifera]
MAVPNSSGEGAAEIVFFDLETTVPGRAGQRFWVLEFGAIVVCPRKLIELESYCTLIRPGDLSAVALRSGRSDGITRQVVATAPTFEDVADKIFGILNGRIWAGHNIQRFDCARIKEAFADIGRPAPVPVGVMDSLGILTQKFGRRAGNMKMATLAAYFGLGQQKHRSLEDVRMNLEVLKHCATVLFLESSLPNVLAGNSQGSPTVTTRSRSNGRLSYGEETSRRSPPTSIGHHRAVPYVTGRFGKMTDRVIKDLPCKAYEKPPLSNFLKHSHSVLR